MYVGQVAPSKGFRRVGREDGRRVDPGPATLLYPVYFSHVAMKLFMNLYRLPLCYSSIFFKVSNVLMVYLVVYST